MFWKKEDKPAEERPSPEAVADVTVEAPAEPELVPQETPKIVDEELRAKIAAYNRNQRLSIAPAPRIALAGMIGGGYGLINGFYRGFRHSALQYLAENAHRMPTTKGGWYFYHKRKNYVIIKDGIVTGVKRGTKYAALATMYFGLEAYIDRMRGVIDAGSTIMASGIAGFAYGISNHLSRRQALRSARAFMIFGAASGALQDFMRFQRGNSVWYMNWMRKNKPDPQKI
ncbi:hypothetical protein TRVA0_001S04742 [Trichomonascus vanleenenianus]|uniref:Tim17/Tim22/Tim23/Pmp24 family protein n=1 Tax=Trichomonascus vanleenenianus TaxID=2268995 RepID=UPI003EC9EA03